MRFCWENIKDGRAKLEPEDENHGDAFNIARYWKCITSSNVCYDINMYQSSDIYINIILIING